MGALGFGISGSGPCLFCWCEDDQQAELIKTEILQLLSQYHTKVDSWVSKISDKGAYSL